MTSSNLAQVEHKLSTTLGLIDNLIPGAPAEGPHIGHRARIRGHHLEDVADSQVFERLLGLEDRQRV